MLMMLKMAMEIIAATRPYSVSVRPSSLEISRIIRSAPPRGRLIRKNIIKSLPEPFKADLDKI